ncbi:hypothetical protein DI53_2543 [Sphingobacterium deserti]|uniref:Uncharacterized protein n=1 Tax=Sphingobacterium deserti TaxID=1229276 RepID=A0A0B8T7J0_9SPHI|nr:hypothetical protein DI53_2543 [Sphingobacterium deserti]
MHYNSSSKISHYALLTTHYSLRTTNQSNERPHVLKIPNNGILCFIKRWKKQSAAVAWWGSAGMRLFPEIQSKRILGCHLA